MIKKHGDKSSKFSAELYSKVYPDGSENHYWTFSRNLIIENALKSHSLQNGTVLDIGAGRGITVDYLIRKGFDCYGCDLGDPKIYPNVKKRVFGSTDAFKLPKKFRSKIETILLLDVLEHIEYPDIFLRKCGHSFPNLKMIVIAVPARPEIWSNYDEFYGHFRRYDLKSLNKLLIQSGFYALENGYFFHLLYAAARFLLLATNKRSLSLNPVSQIWLHRVIGKLLFMEKKFVPRKWYGTSILSVATVR